MSFEEKEERGGSYVEGLVATKTPSYSKFVSNGCRSVNTENAGFIYLFIFLGATVSD